MSEALLLIQAAGALLPVLQSALPALEAALSGQTLTPAQLETIVQARLAIEAQAKVGA
jgi:hypothetical protein